MHEGSYIRREGRPEAMASRLNYYGFAALRHGSHVGVQRVENLKISPGPDRYDPGTLWVKRFGLAGPSGLGRADGRSMDGPEKHEAVYRLRRVLGLRKQESGGLR